MDNKNFKELLPNVEAIIFDVDGVLSTSTIPMGSDGVPQRTVNIKDGYAIHQCVKKGLLLAIISGGTNESVRLRYETLGMEHIYLGAHYKLNELNDFVEKTGVDLQNVMYMGDDLPDIPVMKAVGIPVCPIDAAPEVKAVSLYISDKAGGYGCGRDVIEQVMKAKNIWMDAEAFGW